MTPAEFKARLFSRCVSAEVRAILAKRQMSGSELSAQMSKSNNYVAKRLRGEDSFTTDDLDEICSIVDVSPTEIITAASHTAAQVAKRRQDGYSLAAKAEDQHIGKDQIPDW